MATWKHWFCASAAVAFLTASCLAQSFTITLKQNGNLLGANYYTSDSTHYASVYISPGNPFEPASAKGQDTYVVTWSFTKFIAPPPPPPAPPVGMVTINATAVVPVREIKLTSEGLSLDLDVSSPYVMWASMYDCTALPCIETKPASFPLKGAFEWYTGIGSSAYSSTGSRQSRTIDSACVTNESFNGQNTNGTAIFSGTIGVFTVTPPPVGYNASMTVNKGILRLERVCTPPPM